MNYLYNMLFDMSITNFDKAINEIPDMLITSEPLYIDGYIDNNPVKILIDTGASSSIIYNNAINRLDLHSKVDTNYKSLLSGIGLEVSFGRIWYINLQISNYIFPVSLIVSNNDVSNTDIILGMNFLKACNAILDLENMTLQIKINNEKINISFWK